MDFSPLIVQLKNTSRREMRVRLFDKSYSSNVVKIKMRHPSMPYLLLCAMLKTVQLTITKTCIELTRASISQFDKGLILLRDGQVPEQGNTLDFETPKRYVETNISLNAKMYRIGGESPLPEILLEPGAAIEVSFFVTDGRMPVPTGVGLFRPRSARPSPKEVKS